VTTAATTPLTRELFRTAVAAAVLAPSLHNSQPWRFRLVDGAMQVRADPSRRVPIADPGDWGLRIACGAATANAQLALAAADVALLTQLRPDPADPQLLARLVSAGSRPATPQQRALAAAIPHRHSNRRPFSDTRVPAEAQAALRSAAAEHGAWLELLEGSGPLAVIGEIIRAADRSLRANPEYVREAEEWIRTAEVGAGIPSHAAGVAPGPDDPLPMRDLGGAPRGRFERYEAEPLVGILGVAGDSPYDQLVAGMALQHVLLTATSYGLAASLVSQPIEVADAREKLRRGLGRSGMPQLLMRLGFGQPVFGAPRRAVDEVIDD
jgi:nitroreductase